MFEFIFTNSKPKYKYRIVNNETGDILKLERENGNKTICRVVDKDAITYDESIINLSRTDASALQSYLNNLYREGEWRVICIDDLEMFGIEPK